jgi:hypothetical protein
MGLLVPRREAVVPNARVTAVAILRRVDPIRPRDRVMMPVRDPDVSWI